jgi:hypothetical protein
VQIGTLSPSAGRGFLEQPGASGVLERANLGRGILALRFGDAPKGRASHPFGRPLIYILQHTV